MQKLISLVLALVCVSSLIACNNKSMKYIIENETNITGIVEEVHNDYIIMYSETATGYPNGSYWSISLNVENKDSYTDLAIGDEIVVYYDGNIMETDPLKVGTVYAITLKTPANRPANNKPKVMNGYDDLVETPEDSEQQDFIPMVMVNGELYLDTGHESTIDARCGMMDGEITSEISGTERPTKDNQSNFGTGYGYQYGSQEGTIEIYINEKWCVFATEKVLASSQIIPETSESDTISFQDKTFNKSDLSAETIKWLENYNHLSEEDQLSISYIPSDLYELCGYPTAETIDAEAPAE